MSRISPYFALTSAPAPPHAAAIDAMPIRFDASLIAPRTSIDGTQIDANRGFNLYAAADMDLPVSLIAPPMASPGGVSRSVEQGNALASLLRRAAAANASASEQQRGLPPHSRPN